EEGSVDYRGVADAMARELARGGVEVVTGAEVRALDRRGGVWNVATTAGDRRADFLVNCAGLHSDRMARMAGVRSDVRIVPFRGEYFMLRPERSSLVRHLIYPVPDPSFPFLGVHLTRMIGGGVEAGPNAVLALSREGYRRGQVSARDLAGSVTFPGLWRFLARHPRESWNEVRRSYSKRLFCRALQRLVPSLEADDLETGMSGVRAQAMYPNGSLVEDFVFAAGRAELHVLNAPSPGATASLAIADQIVERL